MQSISHIPKCISPISPQCTILQQKWAHVCTFGFRNGALWHICYIVGCMRWVYSKHLVTLQRRHNGHDGVSNHQPHHCLFKCRSRKTSKLRVTGLCAGNSLVTGEFPAQMASNAENVSIWWRHHDCSVTEWTLCWSKIYNLHKNHQSDRRKLIHII